MNNLAKRDKKLLDRVFEPLSGSILPMLQGLLRRQIERRGAVSRLHRLAGMSINCYYFPAHNGAEGPPIVLIHGIADTALTWIFLLERLRRIGPLYALDLPGFGLSNNPPGQRYATIVQQRMVVEELLCREINRPALLIGNSMGGLVAVKAALHIPALLTGIVLLAPGGALLGGQASWEGFINTVAVPDLRTVRMIYRQMFGRVNPLLYAAQHGFQAMFNRDAVQLILAQTSEADLIAPQELQALQVPVGLIWGMKDEFLPAGSLEYFQEHLPAGSPQLLLPGCGHLPQRERPAQVAAFVQRFVQEHQRR
jgi:pimeloyl-ACP methyl ester carboxylesterase